VLFSNLFLITQGRRVPLRFTLAPGFHIARLWRFVPTHLRALGALFRLICATLALSSGLFVRLGAHFRLICAKPSLFVIVIDARAGKRFRLFVPGGVQDVNEF